ncbi:hypothetical protein TrLO_g1856 [Triparma laevis f. longispina]|uniref:Uncharacterized protein n=1 Tax=Triparma laevis f. longispina TaxID=1714387 RepID=A0A9W7AG41_9STRA|nr:hypothetical protein TrLO_g1856 [Triparma laevis f. longispina]
MGGACSSSNSLKKVIAQNNTDTSPGGTPTMKEGKPVVPYQKGGSSDSYSSSIGGGSRTFMIDGKIQKVQSSHFNAMGKIDALTLQNMNDFEDMFPDDESARLSFRSNRSNPSTPKAGSVNGSVNGNNSVVANGTDGSGSGSEKTEKMELEVH